MNGIWKAIAELSTELHPERIEALAARIAKLGSANDFEKAKSSIGSIADTDVLDRLGEVWRATSDISPSELAVSLRAASATANLIGSRETIEMVWTGPTTGLVPSRHTEQVLLEVIGAARRSLYLVSFVAYNIGAVVEAIRSAIDMGVKVDILLEASTSHGGTLDIDSVRMFSQQIPSANIYTWSQAAKAASEWTGVVHAKCAVADGELAFITSANLTMAAMERNMELGVVVHGGHLPDQLARHLEALITTGIIERV
ncbi:MAG: DISARM system phospholipase D-like protein DrmC [Actinobacteria bacterium]|nr:DISARM system phospholipase D-like protein DrmC [Actinomycetota bacterium]